MEKTVIRARTAPALGPDVAAEIRIFQSAGYDEHEPFVRARAQCLADANDIENCLAEFLPRSTYLAIFHLMKEREQGAQ